MKKKLTLKQLLLKMMIVNEELNMKVPNLNYGGCGVFCKMFYERMKVHFPKMKIVVYDSYMDNRTRRKIIKNVIKGNVSNDWDGELFDDENGEYVSEFTPNHLMIEIGKYHIDGLEVFEHKKYKKRRYHPEYGNYCGYVTFNELIVMLNHGSWNPSFDRRKEKTVKQTLEKHIVVK